MLKTAGLIEVVVKTACIAPALVPILNEVLLIFMLLQFDIKTAFAVSFAVILLKFVL